MIAIVAAMTEEVEAILALMNNTEAKVISNYNFYEGSIANTKVVVTQSGIGKVFAASSTTVLLENYDISLVINIGSAGGLKEDSELLDVIVANKIAVADMDLRAFGYKLSFDEPRITVECDKETVSLLADVIATVNKRVFIGGMITTDQFIATTEQLTHFNKHFSEAYCADMEAGAIGFVCKQYAVKFVVIRSLSDLVHKGNNEISFKENMKKAALNAAIWCEKLIQKIAL